MLKIKKGARFSSFLFLLTILSLFLVLYVAFKDFFLSPKEQFVLAQRADFNKEYKKAEKYYLLTEKAENSQLSVLSSYYLGLLYKKKDANLLKHFQKSEAFLEKAAKKGLAQAQYELALLYDTGDKIEEDHSKAVYWMQKSAEQGFVDAEYAYAIYIDRGYIEGMGMAQSLIYYERAANKGHQAAIKGLALIYKLGAEGIEPNEEKYLFWKNKVLK